MSLGDRIEFLDGSYEIRTIVDGRYVVRIRNRAKNHEEYRIWTEQDRLDFDNKQKNRADLRDRNAEIYERHLSGEAMADIAKDFGISPSRVSGICATQERKERRAQALR